MKKLLVVSLLVAGCGADPQPDSAETSRLETNVEADVAAIRRNIDEAVAAHAAGDANRWTALWEDGGVLMPEGGPTVAGRDAILNWIAEFYQANHFTVKINVHEVEVTGDWAYTRDEFSGTLTPKAGGPSIPMIGKEIVIWRRQTDGSWKASRGIFNSNQPPATQQ